MNQDPHTSITHRIEPTKLLGFVLAGGIATIVNYTLFTVLLLSGLHYIGASATGYLSGILLSYAINRKAVFKATHSPIGPQLFRYFAAYGVALIAQLALLETFVQGGVAAIYANAIALMIVVVGNYFVVRRHVFA